MSLHLDSSHYENKSIISSANAKPIYSMPRMFYMPMYVTYAIHHGNAVAENMLKNDVSNTNF